MTSGVGLREEREAAAGSFIAARLTGRQVRAVRDSRHGPVKSQGNTVRALPSIADRFGPRLPRARAPNRHENVTLLSFNARLRRPQCLPGARAPMPPESLRSQIMSTFNAKRVLLTLVGALALSGVVRADISGAGATFPYPVYS